MPYDYVFPAIRGIQAGHEYFVAMFPLRLVPQVFVFDEAQLMPEQRAQRLLNKGRVPQIARYILDNPTSYVFSALTASVDTPPSFTAMGDGGPEERVGTVRLPLSARFVINDGQHRRAAIQRALQDNPDLGHESIPVVLFPDRGLSRSQQMFADLNRYGIRPTRSLGLLYDHRDGTAITTKLAVFRSELLRDLTDGEMGTPSTRSRKLFTLSSFHSATRSLLQGVDLQRPESADLAADFWGVVADSFPEWRDVRNGFSSVIEVRRTFIHSHAISLNALARIGNSLILASSRTPNFEQSLKRLPTINWRRTNAATWEGRAMTAGRVSMTRTNVLLTTAVIRSMLGMDLPPEEQQLEDLFHRGDT